MDDSLQQMPLAPIQEHFWTANDVDSAESSQAECAAMRVRGPLDRTCLEHAVRSLFERHEVLRSTFVSEGGTPMMCVQSPPESVPLRWLDLEAEAADGDREQAMNEAVEQFAQTGMNLATGPLLRFLVVKLAHDHHVLALSVHHLIADATAVRIIVSELDRDYVARAAGEPSPVAEPELQYSDFAAWERSSLLPVAEDSDAEFWETTLRDASGRLDLRLDRPRPPLKGSSGTRAEFELPAAISSRLLDFARECRTTPYAVSLAAFAALIARSTGDDDLILGVLTANRSVEQIENLIGQFSNTVPLRIGVDGDPHFAELATRCGRTIADAIEHSRLPLSRIFELAKPARDASRTPLIQHLFLPKVDALGTVSFAGLPTEELEVNRQRSRFDTVVEIDVSPAGGRIWIEYDTSLYTDVGIAAMMHDYEQILAEWLAHPRQRLSELSLGQPPADGASSPSLASTLGLDSSDTVVIHGIQPDPEPVRAAAAEAGASLVVKEPADAPPPTCTVASVPGAEFAKYVDNSPAHRILVSEPVRRKDLERLRTTNARQALRLIHLPHDRVLVADFTDCPDTWPTLRGWYGPDRVDVGDGRLSPYAPAPLYVDSEPTSLLARRNPSGDVEIVDGLDFVDDTADPAGDTSTDDALLGVMCELWADALEIPTVQPDEDFFVLGGHSMVAARLIADLNDTLGITVRLRTLFENPTAGALVTALRSEYGHLDELLQLIDSAAEPELEAEPPSVAESNPAEPELIPLLAAQRQLWLAEQANPGSLTHTIPLLLRIDGPVDVDALRAGVGDVVERQAGLRASFIEQDGMPMQVIAPYDGFDVPVVDLRELPPEERSERNQALEHETAYGGFDLKQGPLLRARLVRLEDERNVLHLLFHHIVTDEVSMTVFMNELAEFYRARVEGRPHRLPPLQLSFADLVQGEHDMLAGSEGDRLRRFWSRTLADAPRLVVPTDHPRPERPTFVGEFVGKRESAELRDLITEFARKERTTAFTVFCATVVAQLHYISGQTDLVLGMPTDNRAIRGSDQLVGCFINVIPMRVSWSGELTFSQLLERVQQSMLRSYEHQHLPFSEIVETVRPDRTQNLHPIYQVTCELQLADWMPFQIPGCHIDYDLLAHGTSAYDLSYHAMMDAEGIRVMLELNTDMWDRHTGDTWIQQVVELLANVIERPDVPLTEHRP